MNHRVAIFRLLGLHFQQEVTLKHLLYSKEKPVNHWLTGLVVAGEGFEPTTSGL